MNGAIGELLVIVVLVLVTGIFVAAEIALVTVRRSRLEQLASEGSAAAARVRRLIDDPGRFLAVRHVAVTFIGFLASAFAAVSLTQRLEAALQDSGMNKDYAG